MILNISLLICLSLLIYSYYVLSEDKHLYSNMKKVSRLLNLGVSDKHVSRTNDVAYGQSSRPWFLQKILDNCRLDGLTEKEIFVGLSDCIPPFCQINTPHYKNVVDAL